MWKNKKKEEHWHEIQSAEEERYLEAKRSLFRRLKSDERSDARKWSNDYRDLVEDTEDE